MSLVRPERKLRILNLLVEGNSIRSTDRLTRTHRDTIMRILVGAGQAHLRQRPQVHDLAGRLRPGNPERHQLSTDGFSPYPDAVAEAFRHFRFGVRRLLQ